MRARLGRLYLAGVQLPVLSLGAARRADGPAEARLLFSERSVSPESFLVGAQGLSPAVAAAFWVSSPVRTASDARGKRFDAASGALFAVRC